MNRLLSCLAIAVLVSGMALPAAAQQVTGLSGWSIYLDPGHSQNENVGVYGYSEARKTLRIGLELRRLLLETTDIDTVYVSRTSDQQSVSLTQRVDHANATRADFYLSIHSNAAGPTANFAFVLWPQHRDGAEVQPKGGRAMAETVAAALSEGMRIDSRGGIGECDFYGASNCRVRNLSTGKGGSRNFVQSFTNMASALGEAGFHTNPGQNLRNMNADWKRLEARSEYWGILAYHGLERERDRILTGIVSDLESGIPINGAQIAFGDTSYVTDTWEGLFREFSSDPGALSNGFYYLDRLAEGERPISVEADGYESYDDTATPLEGRFTFHDVGLISTALARVASSNPTARQDPFPITNQIRIEFNRPMDRSKTEAAFGIDPVTDGSFAWSSGDRRLTFRPDSLRARTEYTVVIASGAAGAHGHAFDGDGDGAAGGSFVTVFTTGFPDTRAATITTSYPRQNSRDVALRPVLNLVYDEPLDSTTVQSRIHLEETSTAVAVPGTVRYWRVGQRGLISFFPDAPLQPATAYQLVVLPGLRDLFLNEETRVKQLRFTTGSTHESFMVIDDFEEDLTANWWQPQQSGSTTGIRTDSTSMAADTLTANALFGGRVGMRVAYGWSEQAAEPLIREYLGGGIPRAEIFNAGQALRVYVFGDGSGTRFRFAVDDRVPDTASSNHEVSQWYTVDWIGWQPVTWVLHEDPVGTWIGDGVLNGQLRIDSFQLTRSEGSASAGTLVFDDLQRLDAFSTASEDDPVPPGPVLLEQNYPNPFNPVTTIGFSVPQAQRVRLTVYDVLGRLVRVLEDRTFPAGGQSVLFDASSVSSGVYLYRMETAQATITRRMTVMK